MSEPADNERHHRFWRPEVAGILFVTLLGTALRLYKLADTALWYDEGASLYFSKFVPRFWELFDPANNTEAPINSMLTWAWYLVVQAIGYPVTAWQNDFLIRLLPCLCSISGIPLLFLFSRKLLGDARTALIAAGLFAVSPFYLYYAQELRIYAFLVPASLLTFWAMLCALDEGRLRYWIAFGIGLLVLLYSHFFSVWIVFALSVYFALRWLFDRRHLAAWTATNAIVLCLFYPGLVLAMGMNEVVNNLSAKWYDNPTWKSMLITFKIFFAGYGPTAWAYWGLFGIALFLHLVGVLVLLRGRWRAALFVAVLVWVPLYGNVILWSMRHFSFYEHRLFAVSGIVAMIGVAAGLRALQWPAVRWGVVALWLLLTAPMLRDFYTHQLHPIHEHRWGMNDKVDFRDAAAFIEANWQDGDRVVYPHHFFVYSLHHYLPDKPHLRIGFNESYGLHHIQSFGHEELSTRHGLMPVPKEKGVAGAKRLWYLESHGITFEWKPQTAPIREWLDTHFTAVERHEYDGLELILYAPH